MNFLNQISPYTSSAGSPPLQVNGSCAVTRTNPTVSQEIRTICEDASKKASEAIYHSNTRYEVTPPPPGMMTNTDYSDRACYFIDTIRKSSTPNQALQRSIASGLGNCKEHAMIALALIKANLSPEQQNGAKFEVLCNHPSLRQAPPGLVTQTDSSGDHVIGHVSFADGSEMYVDPWSDGAVFDSPQALQTHYAAHPSDYCDESSAKDFTLSDKDTAIFNNVIDPGAIATAVQHRNPAVDQSALPKRMEIAADEAGGKPFILCDTRREASEVPDPRYLKQRSFFLPGRIT